MNANAPQVQQPQEDPWIPRRVHDSFRRVRRVGRGRNRRYVFRGQQPDETVKMVLRAHKFFLILPALPLVGTIIGLFVVIGLSGRFPGAGPFWTLLEYISVIAIIVRKNCPATLGHWPRSCSSRYRLWVFLQPMLTLLPKD